MIYALIAALLFALGANWWDNLNTVKAIAKGFVESNPLVTVVVGDKPSLWQLIAITQGLIAILFVAGVFLVHTPLAAGPLAAVVVAGIKHILGARAGAKVLKG